MISLSNVQYVATNHKGIGYQAIVTSLMQIQFFILFYLN